MEINPEEIFSSAERQTAIVGIAIVTGIYARLTGDAKPLAVFVVLLSISVAIHVINHILGKAKS